MAIRVFYSFAQKDSELLISLRTHLVMMERNEEIDGWSGLDVQAGQEHRKIAEHNLSNAQIILLLLSRDYLAADYLYEHEMTTAIRMHQAGRARVVPIILRHCDWQEARVGGSGISLGNLSPLPKDGKPVMAWMKSPDDIAGLDAAFQDIAGGLRRVIATMNLVPESKPDKPDAADTYRPEIPEILPYLCDRKDQEDLLEIALGKEGGGASRPFVCVIHGNEDECHEEFRDRLELFSLPRFFDVDTSQVSVRAKKLEWPSRSITPHEAQEILRKDLAWRLLKKRGVTIDEVAEEVARWPAPVMIYSHMSSGDWETGGSQMIEAFMTFWENFPNLPTGSHLISSLFITHPVGSRGASESKSECLRYLRGLSTFKLSDQSLEDLRRERVSVEAIDLLKALVDRKVEGEELFLATVETALGPERAGKYREPILRAARNLEFSGYGCISGLVLPELAGVTLQDVEEWIKEEEYFRDICRIRKHKKSFCKGKDVVSWLEREFYKDSQPRVPMRPLAELLKRLIEENRC